MIEFLTDAGRQVPALAIFAAVIYFLMKSFQGMVKTFIGYLESRDEVLKTIGDGCHEVQKEATKVISENTKVIAEVRDSLQYNNKTLKEIRDVVS